MKLTQRGEYGLLALLELARCYGQGPLQAGAIADARGIPTAYLQHILLTLRRAGLVRSERGSRGGHELALEPGSITLLAAVEALEGSTAPAPCVDAGGMPSCPGQAQCVLADVWREVDEAARAILAGITLAELARRERAAEATPMYYI